MARKHGTSKTTCSSRNEHPSPFQEKLLQQSHTETGTEINYNIKQARKQHELIVQHMQKQHKNPIQARTNSNRKLAKRKTNTTRNASPRIS